MPQLVRAYAPDILFIQLGIDTHFSDPLTHLQITTQGFTEKRFLEAVESSASEAGGTVAVGGGGYDMGAVARAWTMALAEMADYELPEQVPESYDSVNGLTTFADEPWSGAAARRCGGRGRKLRRCRAWNR